MALTGDMVKLVSKGFLRTNQFRVAVYPPLVVSKASWLDLSIKAIPIPGYGIETVPDVLGGKVSTKMASTYSVANLDLTFYITTNMEVYDMFEEWRQLIVDVPSNRLGYYDDYVGTIELTVQTRNERALRTVTYEKVWPLVVGDVDLSFDTENGVGLLASSFAYRQYSISPAGGW